MAEWQSPNPKNAFHHSHMTVRQDGVGDELGTTEYLQTEEKYF